MADVRPWFPLYVYDFETSQRVRAMTFEAEGVYNALLRSQWANGSVPASDEGLRTCLLKPCSQEALDAVKPCFPADPDNPSVRANPRLKGLRSQASSKREGSVLAGRKGGVLSGLSRRRVASSKPEPPLEATLQASLKPPFSEDQPMLLAESAPDSRGTGLASKETTTTTDTSNNNNNNNRKEKEGCKHPKKEQRVGTAIVPANRPSLVLTPQESVVRAKASRRKLVEAGLDLAAEAVFRYWRDLYGFHPTQTLFGPDRKKRVIDRLRENGGDVSELLYSLDGGTRDDWTMGRDARSTKKFNDLELLMRNRGKVERNLVLVPDRKEMHPYLEASDAQG